jgi:hypothetical protein
VPCLASSSVDIQRMLNSILRTEIPVHFGGTHRPSFAVGQQSVETETKG